MQVWPLLSLTLLQNTLDPVIFGEIDRTLATFVSDQDVGALADSKFDQTQILAPHSFMQQCRAGRLISSSKVDASRSWFGNVMIQFFCRGIGDVTRCG